MRFVHISMCLFSRHVKVALVTGCKQPMIESTKIRPSPVNMMEEGRDKGVEGM